MTSFYSWRLIFLTFFGEARGDRHTHDHAHESPLSMLIPLGVLAAGALFSGMIWYGSFFGDNYREFFGASVFFRPENTVIHDAHYAPTWVVVSPFVAMVAGFLIALWFYILNPAIPGQLARSQEPLYKFLLNRWYFDEIYDRIIVRPTLWLGTALWKGGDGRTIDGAINGVAMGIVPYVTRLAGRAQSGYLFHYAFAMFLGLVALIVLLAIAGNR
jgi:NADH-quinone oxidoreductase subunit L